MHHGTLGSLSTGGCYSQVVVSTGLTVHLCFSFDKYLLWNTVYLLSCNCIFLLSVKLKSFNKRKHLLCKGCNVVLFLLFLTVLYKCFDKVLKFAKIHCLLFRMIDQMLYILFGVWRRSRAGATLIEMERYD